MSETETNRLIRWFVRGKGWESGHRHKFEKFATAEKLRWAEQEGKDPSEMKLMREMSIGLPYSVEDMEIIIDKLGWAEGLELLRKCAASGLDIFEIIRWVESTIPMEELSQIEDLTNQENKVNYKPNSLD